MEYFLGGGRIFYVSGHQVCAPGNQIARFSCCAVEQIAVRAAFDGFNNSYFGVPRVLPADVISAFAFPVDTVAPAGLECGMLLLFVQVLRDTNNLQASFGRAEPHGGYSAGILSQALDSAGADGG